MRDRLQDFGGSGERIVFAHANGYPPGSYQQFINHLTPHFHVLGFHQRPLWSAEHPPVRLNWRRLADDMIETLGATQAGPVWMMGHSMGATLSTFAAVKKPELFKGLLLIDPVYMSTRRVARAQLTPARRQEKWPMIHKTLNRPDRFSDHNAAFDFYRGKRVFSKFSDQVLLDYVHAGTRPTGEGDLQLAYAREWEAAAYRSTPWVWPRVAKLKLPVLGLRGESSDTLNQASFRRWQRLQPQAELHTCPGGHLLPMEHPEGTARYVIDYLLKQTG